MARYLRLYMCMLRFAFSRAMVFRLDFFFRIAMDVVFYAVHIAFFEILYLQTSMFGGWNRDQVLVFIAGYLFSDSVHMTLTANGLWSLPFFINRGDLDYYLVRPVSPLFFLLMRDFAANSFVNMLLGCGVLGWALWRYPAALGAGNIAVYIALLLAGVALVTLMNLVFIIPVFWTQSGIGFRTIYFRLTVCQERPHQIYGTWTRRVLMSALPMALVASYPAHVLFYGPTPERLGVFFGVLGAYWAAVLWFWNRGLRSYASASS